MSSGVNFQRRSICMNDISNRLSCLVHFKNVYFYNIPIFIFEIMTFKQILTVVLEQEVPMCKFLISYNRKSIKQIISICTPNVSYNEHTLTLKIWVQYMTKYNLQKASKILRWNHRTVTRLGWGNILTWRTKLIIIYSHSIFPEKMIYHKRWKVTLWNVHTVPHTG